MTLALEARAAVLGLGWLVGIAAEEAQALFEQGLVLAASSNDPRWRVRLIAHYAGIKAGQGAVEDYLRLTREAVELADRGDDVGLRAAVRTPLVRAHLVAGRIREALEICEQALAGMPAEPAFGNILGYSPYLNLSLLRADLLGYVGRWSDAAAAFESSMRVCREHRHFVMLAHACIDYAWWKALFGSGDALAQARLGLEMAEKLGSRMTRLFAHNALGFAELRSGHAAQALAVLEQARELAAEMHNVPETQVDTLSLFARAALAAGDHERAREAADQAVAAARRWRTLAWECIAQLAYAEVRIENGADGSSAEIAAALDRAAALVEETGARCFEPVILAQRAALARRRSTTSSQATR